MDTLKAEKRSMETKAKRLRREGYVTGNVFGQYTCCEVSKKLILNFVEEVEYNYGNRIKAGRLP